ncbi:hypothetical protein [Rossellomorea aquimaris]|uniref:hypothetical protein n=1 Tax=Rossellomorea aquimaris TaxID=189382 RepID=UPI001CFD72E4|nr:hypothetical protein [Rossellomorea aquimaris]
MKNNNKAVYIILILWVVATVYLFYKYSLQAGYWNLPLYTSLALYFLLVIVNKGFSKLIASLFLVYFIFGLWFIVDLIVSIGEVLGP